MSSIKTFIKSHNTLRGLLTPPVRLFRRLLPSENDRRSKSLAELFRPVRDGSLVVELGDFNGSFEIGARSDILRRVLISGRYEPEIVKVVKENLDGNRDAIDVGANVGLFAVLLGSLLSKENRVLAVEPTPGALKFLRRNLERNKTAEKIIVFEGIASHTCGEAVLKVVSGKEEYSSTGNMVYPSIKDESHSLLTVASDTIDNLVERFSLRPGFIKIDTEGSEYDVLRGCEKTLLNYRPVVLCESWDDQTLVASGGVPGATASLLAACGYNIFKHIDGEILGVPKEGRASVPIEKNATAAAARVGR